MFRNCKNLKNINLSSFDTKNVTNMKNMFYGCNNLIDINLSSFDTKNDTKMNNMFYDCNNLKKIILNKNSKLIKNELSNKDIEIIFI